MADIDTTADQEALPPDDIKSLVSAAFDEAAAASAEPIHQAPAPSAERPRGPDGKFLKADASEAPETVAEAPKTPEIEPAQAPPDDLAKATARWSQVDRDMLAKLPPEAQEFLARRHRDMEADHTRKTTEIAAIRKEYEPIDQIFAPYADQMRQAGLTKAGLIQGWAGAEQALMRGGEIAAQFVANVVNTYKIDRGAVARHLGVQGQTAPSAAVPSAAEPPAPQPPANAPVLPPEIEQRLARYDQFMQQQALTEQQRAAAAFNEAAGRVTSDIEQFAAAKDSAGALLHPHFHDVENDMAVLAQLARASSGKVPPLSDLYDQAVWANPSTRAKLQADAVASQEAQRAQVEKQRQQEARAKAERATRAAKSTTGAPPSGPARRSTGSLRDELMEAADQLESA